MSTDIFSITITHPHCREGRVNHWPLPQLRRIKYIIFDMNIWYLIDPAHDWEECQQETSYLPFHRCHCHRDQINVFFMSEKSLTPMSSHEEPIVEKMPLWINGFLCPPFFFWLRTLWAQKSRKSNSICAQSTVQPWYISYKCKTINSLS